MRVDAFDYTLPSELIAGKPASPRDAARLLVVKDALLDKTMRNLPDFLESGDVLVCNDTRVIPARITGYRGNARIEVTLHKALSPTVWSAFAKPAKRLKEGDTFIIADDFEANVTAKKAGGEIMLSFAGTTDDFRKNLLKYGRIPLPPYIRRTVSLTTDHSDYQTIFAQKEGAVAAPTAGLHFTERLLEALEKKGVQCVFLTLHVGAGTFLPVKAEDTSDHMMHSEWCSVSSKTADTINKRKGRLAAVGTTALRTLETAASEDGTIHPYEGETNLFITPGYRFKSADLLLTNFHLPKSTLFMLVCAFAGMEKMKAAYRHAIGQKYRFYSYGDATLLYRN